jgi:hypothetical protein
MMQKTSKQNIKKRKEAILQVDKESKQEKK